MTQSNLIYSAAILANDQSFRPTISRFGYIHRFRARAILTLFLAKS